MKECVLCFVFKKRGSILSENSDQDSISTVCKFIYLFYTVIEFTFLVIIFDSNFLSKLSLIYNKKRFYFAI